MRRRVLLLMLVGCALMVLAVVLVGGGSSEPVPHQNCGSAEDRERIRGLMLEALDKSLKDHTENFFDVWIRDPSDQPKRAATGMHGVISAYLRSRAAALRWDMPPC